MGTAFLRAIVVVGLATGCGSAFTTAGQAADAGGDATEDAAVEASPTTCGGNTACVAGAPEGWSGPGELYAGASAAPACGGDFTSAYQGNAGLSASGASCSCSCVGPATVCEPPALDFSKSNACGSTCDAVPLTPDVCTTVNVDTVATCGVVAPAITYISALNPVLGAAKCSPSLTKQVPSSSWAVQAQACSPTGALAQADCSAGSVCAPVPAAGYGAGLCIWQSGDVSCPAGAYVKHLFYGGVDDTRDCEACGCGAVTGASCAGALDVYTSTNASCGGGAVTFNTPITCAGNGLTEDVRLTITTTAGSCAASGGTAIGTAMPASPTTFCCPF